MTERVTHLPERIRSNVDALVVLGKNIGVDWGADEVAYGYPVVNPKTGEKTFKRNVSHLSPHARINVIAAGLLYDEGMAPKIVFSSGETVKGYSEAELMRDHLRRLFPHIPDEAVLLENRSRDTRENANEIAKMNLGTIALVTVGFHTERSEMLFRKAGVNPESVLGSEDIVAMRFPKLVEKYKNSDLYKREAKKERSARKVQSIPVMGTAASIAVTTMRGRKTPSKNLS